MDDRLQRALEQANYNLTLQTQKKNYQLRFQNACAYAAHGGSFTASQQLIAFVATLAPTSMGGVIIDDRGNPVMIPDMAEFLAALISTYQEAANELYLNMEKLRKARTTKTVVGL